MVHLSTLGQLHRMYDKHSKRFVVIKNKLLFHNWAKNEIQNKSMKIKQLKHNISCELCCKENGSKMVLLLNWCFLK